MSNNEAVHRLISADSHVNMPIDAWREYLPAELRDAAPRMERTDGADFQVFEGKRKPIAASAALAGFRPQEFTQTVRRYDDVRPGGWEPAPRIEDQDADGVVAEVLFGNVGDAPLPSEDPAMTRASFTAYNRWLADFCSYDPARFVGIAYVPCDDPDDAIAEARLGAELGLRGAVIPHTPSTGEWVDAAWAPFFRTLTELGLPAHLHVSVGTRRNPGPITSRGDLFMNYMVSSKLDNQLSLGRFVFGGVLAAHPELKLVSVEAQIGWIPFWKQYIDGVYDRHQWWTDHHLSERPSAYADRQIWFTFMDDPQGVETRHACGIDRIMWSNDYPHSETTWPHSQKIAGEMFEHIPAEDARKIVHDNCRDLYGL